MAIFAVTGGLMIPASTSPLPIILGFSNEPRPNFGE
jgi:hypothetical protein